METTVEAMAQAVVIVQQATACDLNGDTENAILVYGAAASRLEELVAFVPAEHGEVLRRNAEEIRRRLEIVRQDRVSKDQDTTYPKFSIQFVPQPVPIESFVVPEDLLLRPFWLARVLRRSIQDGAFLTPSLYVSKDVWHQDGGAAVVSHLQTKTVYLSSWCEGIAPLRAMSALRDSVAIQNALATFTKTVVKLNSGYDAEVGRGRGDSASSSRLWKGMSDLWQKGQHALRGLKGQQTNLDLFLVWAVNVLDQAQLLERWIVYYHQLLQSAAEIGGASVRMSLGSSTGSGNTNSSLEAILEQLRIIGMLLYSGPCSILLQDMMLLVQRYQEESRKSVSRFLPVDVKFDAASSDLF